MRNVARMSMVLGVVAGAACCLAPIPKAHAQPGTFTDVIVGDLMEISFYNNNSRGGTILGRRAYAVGTTSCNLGNRPLTWIDEGSSVLYPVISQNMYRLNNGRFEQIGQSWLKHGFCALNGNACATCPQQSNPACAYLMPSCSDPYSASLNGTQSGLGPKWEINPVTGAIPVNPSFTGVREQGDSTQNDRSIYKRLQIYETDMLVPNSLFFVSSTYIHPEDAGFDTDMNNQSYRRLNINTASTPTNPPTFAPTLTDSTQRQKPAIFAWREYGNGASGGQGVLNPNVVLASTDVPSDGRFWVGVHPIQNQNGTFRYEYAVYNHNSNRGARSFSVPIPAGATVSGAGFRDVPYHSGELQRGDDWTVTVANGAITWTMPDLYGDDRWENVLRWDTIYNFWFECNLPPATGTVTLGLFGNAAPADTTVNIPVPSTSGSLANDTCSGALNIPFGSTTINTTNANSDGFAECTNANQSQIDNDVWFSFLTDCGGQHTVSICDATFDTKIAVYSACPTGANQAIACNDDTSDCGTNGLGSRVTFSALPSTRYYVRVGAFPTANPSTGSGTLSVTGPNCNEVLNDTCATAQFLVDGQTWTGTTQFANIGTEPANCNGAGTRDVWFAYRPNASGTVTISTCGSSFDTVLNLYTACGNPVGSCNDDGVAGSCPTSGTASRLVFTGAAGQTYYIRLSAWSGDGNTGRSGPYSINIVGGGGALPPTNDDCANREGLGLGLQAISTLSATTDGPQHGSVQIFNDSWYNHPGTCDGTLIISTCGGSIGFDSALAVYDGTGCSDLASRLIATSTSAACGGDRAEVSVPTQVGRALTIRVGSASAGSRGTGGLTLTCVPNITCDDIDFNNDGIENDPTDIESFLSVYSGGPCLPAGSSCNDIDFNNDGIENDPTDIESFLSVYSGGPCIR